MKLTIVLLTAAFLNVYASGSGQSITLKGTNLPVTSVFEAIEAQTGYVIFSNKELLANAKPVTVNAFHVPLADFLKLTLKNQPFAYKIAGKTVVISEKVTSERPIDVVNDLMAFFPIKGTVKDGADKPLAGISITIKASSKGTVTASDGSFSLDARIGDVLIISGIGFEKSELKVKTESNYDVVLKTQSTQMDTSVVSIISTGYQNIPKERATGSFTQVDNKTFSRAVSPDILTRLNGVTNGLLFEESGGNTGNALGISVRGRSTIFSNTTPLIVVDNFPFDGDLNSLNPETIENITVLKDAAAASIWGVRAGNGVIVITTKRGNANQKPVISAKSDLTLGEKPNLHYEPRLSSSEFIDVEQFLFDKGAYTATINNGYETISPVVEILQRIKVDPGYAVKGKAEIDALRNVDYRNQQSKYFYRKSALQRYFVDVSGGSNNQTYYFSAGYDKTLSNIVTQSDSRITLKATNSYQLLNDRLRLNTDITFSQSKSDNINVNTGSFLPYQQIADENGNALPILLSGGLRSIYTDTAGKGRLLDWKYRPLEELRNESSTSNRNLTDYRINLGLSYKILKSLTFSVEYQYYNANLNAESLNTKESFSSRNLINTYSQINAVTGSVIRAIPFGDIYNPRFESKRSNYGRGQISYNENIGYRHQFNAIAGYEIRDNSFKSNSVYLYGYNPETATSIQIDPINEYRNYVTNGLNKIGQAPRQSGNTDRYLSYYGNISYSYDSRYILSGSYRKDESNIFGVKANQKGVPLWSAGFLWNVNKERFFNIDWLGSLQLKATYGYNGNVNNLLSAYLTASPSEINVFNNLQYYSIVNPPNAFLRWERVKNINLGFNFSTKNDRISGSIEYYAKNGLDLIANSPIAPQTGVSIFTGNTANTHTRGFDIQLNSKNLVGKFQWATTYILNNSEDKVTRYRAVVGSNEDVVASSVGGLVPLVGYPINSAFAYKWAGLDATGNPQGYLDKSISIDYTRIRNSSDRAQLDFFGSRTPTFFGSIRNTVSYNNFELSFNIGYKFGYYFRRQSFNNTTLYSSPIDYLQYDYAKRWQQPGDELNTSVPSAIYPDNNLRSSFYNYSSVLIERGDHIRLQDIQLNYNLSKQQFTGFPLKNLNLYLYASNFGVMWKANKHGIDPDYRTGLPNSKTIAIGVKANFK